MRDYYEDYYEYYGTHDAVSYCRWLFNRFGANEVADEFNIPKQLAHRIATSDLPGKTKMSELPTMEAVKERERLIHEVHDAQERKSRFQSQFHKEISRKLKIRLNKLCENPKLYVLRNLLEAEEFNIKAKDCLYKYIEYNYGKKGEFLKNAIGRLPETGWPFWWQKNGDGVANYVFFVELPAGQVSWHGTNCDDMNNVPMDNDRQWDGARAVTMPRIIESVMALCPSIMDEPFNKEKCLQGIA